MKLLFITFLLVIFSTHGMCYTDEDIDKATTYAAMIGRAAGCGIKTENEVRRVGAWLDRTFSGDMRTMQLLIFMEGMKLNAQQQAEGKTGDTCATVRRVFEEIDWP